MTDNILNALVDVRVVGTIGVEPSVVACVGALGSACLLALIALQYVGLVDTGIGVFVVDQLVNGESRFNANGDIHGDWGNIAFSILAAPALIGMYAVAGISFVRKYFTGTAA